MKIIVTSNVLVVLWCFTIWTNCCNWWNNELKECSAIRFQQNNNLLFPLTEDVSVGQKSLCLNQTKNIGPKRLIASWGKPLIADVDTMVSTTVIAPLWTTPGTVFPHSIKKIFKFLCSLRLSLTLIFSPPFSEALACLRECVCFGECHS